MDRKQHAGLAAVVLVAIGAAAVGYVIARKRSQGEPEAVEPQVERWEDEGGNVPDAPTPVAG